MIPKVSRLKKKNRLTFRTKEDFICSYIFLLGA